jgi:hypothetical protein
MMRLTLAALAALLCVCTALPAAEARDAAEVFDELAAIARAYPGAGVEMVCKETLRWRYFHEGGRTRWADQAVQEYRVSRNADGAIVERRTTDSTRATRLEILDRPFFWLELFAEPGAELHRFELRGEEEWEGRPALRVDFRPRAEEGRRGADEWYGSIWLDPRSLQPLRASGTRAGAYEALRAMLDSEDEPPLPVEERTFLLERASTTFGLGAEVPVATDGETGVTEMRFPSEAELESSRHIVKLNGTRKKPTVLTLIKHEYADCRWVSDESGDGAD